MTIGNPNYNIIRHAFFTWATLSFVFSLILISFWGRTDNS